MKLTLLLCALVFAVPGWCASGPAHHVIRIVAADGQPPASTQTQLEVQAKTAFVIWGFILYLVALLWWTRSTKNSLDRTMSELRQMMTQY